MSDEHHGKGGSYIIDAVSGLRRLVERTADTRENQVADEKKIGYARPADNNKQAGDE